MAKLLDNKYDYGVPGGRYPSLGHTEVTRKETRKEITDLRRQLAASQREVERLTGEVGRLKRAARKLSGATPKEARFERRREMRRDENEDTLAQPDTDGDSNGS